MCECVSTGMVSMLILSVYVVMLSLQDIYIAIAHHYVECLVL